MLHKAITKTLQRKAKDRRGKNQDLYGKKRKRAIVEDFIQD